jgi:hypothetical protein
MDTSSNQFIKFLGANFPKQDLHVMEVKNEQDLHIGYYFWQGGEKVHELQLIRSMRLEIGLDALEIRQMCADAKVIRLSFDNDDIVIV